jgi:hypothetical protein
MKELALMKGAASDASACLVSLEPYEICIFLGFGEKI